jgi:hypothetical protein
MIIVNDWNYYHLIGLSGRGCHERIRTVIHPALVVGGHAAHRGRIPRCGHGLTDGRRRLPILATGWLALIGGGCRARPRCCSTIPLVIFTIYQQTNKILNF